MRFDNAVRVHTEGILERRTEQDDDGPRAVRRLPYESSDQRNAAQCSHAYRRQGIQITIDATNVNDLTLVPYTTEFSASQRQEKLCQRENNAQAQQMSARHGGDNNSARFKSMARTMSSAALPRAALLWDLKVDWYRSIGVIICTNWLIF